MRLGLFGGSFDPPHYGHLIFAEEAREALNLDKVLFVPAYHSPFKPGGQSANVAQRCEMVELAVNDNKHFELSIYEAEREQTSYTVDTLRHFSALYPESELFLLIGADTFAEFKDWKEPEEILNLAQVAVTLRPDAPHDIRALPFGENVEIVEMPLIDISSTDIRRRVREGRSTLYLCPWPVRTFIEYMEMYR